MRASSPANDLQSLSPSARFLHGTMETSRPDQSDRDIVDVGAGGAGDNQAIAFLQGMVGIVISQRGKDIAALGF